MPKKPETLIHKILHILEQIIAYLTLAVLIGMLGLELYKLALDVLKMTSTPDYFVSLDTYLHNILTIVVGLEFVRMLIDMTPGNTLEVLIMATARHIIMNHNNPVTLLIGILCIAGLFATRRFLIRRSEMTEDLVELD